MVPSLNVPSGQNKVPVVHVLPVFKRTRVPSMFGTNHPTKNSWAGPHRYSSTVTEPLKNQTKIQPRSEEQKNNWSKYEEKVHLIHQMEDFQINTWNRSNRTINFRKDENWGEIHHLQQFSHRTILNKPNFQSKYENRNIKNSPKVASIFGKSMCEGNN